MITQSTTALDQLEHEPYGTAHGRIPALRRATLIVTPLDITMLRRHLERLYGPRLPKDLNMLTPSFTLRDLQNGATPMTLAHGRELAKHIEGLDWDEYSLWGCLPSEGIGVASVIAVDDCPSRLRVP